MKRGIHITAYTLAIILFCIGFIAITGELIDPSPLRIVVHLALAFSSMYGGVKGIEFHGDWLDDHRKREAE